MNNGDDFFDFMIEGGDELLNSEECFQCGAVIHFYQNIEWIDKAKQIVKCPECGEQIKLE